MFLNKIKIGNFRNISSWNLPKLAQLNVDYLCNKSNYSEIEHNISHRKGIGNIGLVHELLNKNESDLLYKEMLKIPNRTHPEAPFGNEPKIVKTVSEPRKFDFPIKEFNEIAKRLKLVRTDQLGNLSGNRSYYILGELAEIERALINYVTEQLQAKCYDMVSVPDILPKELVESCGMNTSGERNQVYKINEGLCLSGTSEISLAGLYANQLIDESQLPIKLMSTSRCYRAETSSIAEERGIYRVHEFTKVEMFVLTKPEDSDKTLEIIRETQQDLFEGLGLHFKVLDMPAHELGAQAYRKYDIEAWMPGRNMFGEISSCSNCTDFQSRRLNIKYKTSGKENFVHTLNGTACAIPRLLISLTETYQNNNGTITVPEVLQKYLGKTHIARQKIPELKLIKNKK